MDVAGRSILITGGAGFIGARLSASLTEAGAKVTVFDNLLDQVHGDNSANLDRLAAAQLQPVVGDVRDADALQAAFDASKPEIVIHLAAETGTGQSFDEPDRYCAVNVQGTAHLINAIRKSGTVKRVLLAGSRAVYGEGACVDANGAHQLALPRGDAALAAGQFAPKDAQGRDLTPVPTAAANTAVQPASIYASTKLMQEYLLEQAFWGTDIGVGIIRLQNVYGPGQSLSNPYTGVLSIFTRQIMEGKTLNIYEDGEITRDFVYVDDVVAAFVALCTSDVLPAGICDIGSGEASTIINTARTLLELLGADTGKTEITGDYRPGDIRYGVADITAARDALNWTPKVDLQTGLHALVEWSKTQQAEGAL